MPTGEQESRQRIRDWYGLESDVLVEIEREVIGGDNGAKRVHDTRAGRRHRGALTAPWGDARA